MLKREYLSTRIYPRALRSEDPVRLDSVQLMPEQVTAEFDEDLAHRQELIETLRHGTVLHPVSEMPRATTFSVEGPTKSFWIKLFYARDDPDRVERVHIMGVSRQGSEIKHINVD